MTDKDRRVLERLASRPHTTDELAAVGAAHSDMEALEGWGAIASVPVLPVGNRLWKITREGLAWYENWEDARRQKA